MKKLLVPAAFGAALVLGLGAASPVRAAPPRGIPIVVPSLAAQSINPNPVIAPGLTLQQYAYNTAVLGRALSTVPPYAYGYNPYTAVANYGPVYRNYGNPYLNPYVNPYLVTPSYYYPTYPSVSPYFP